MRSSVETDFSELVLMEQELPLKRTAPEEDSGVFLKRRKACSQPITNVSHVENASFSPDVSSDVSTTAATTIALRKTLFDYGFQKKTSHKFQRSFSESAATIARAIEQCKYGTLRIFDFIFCV